MKRKPLPSLRVEPLLVPVAGLKPQRLPKLKEAIPFLLFAEAQGWVLKRLRLRQKREVAEVAQMAHVGDRTLRDLEQQKHLNTAISSYVDACALGYHPDRIALLTRRWLRKYLRRVQPRRTNDGL